MASWRCRPSPSLATSDVIVFVHVCRTNAEKREPGAGMMHPETKPPSDSECESLADQQSPGDPSVMTLADKPASSTESTGTASPLATTGTIGS